MAARGGWDCNHKPGYVGRSPAERLAPFYQVRQEMLALALVMPVQLAIGSNQDELSRAIMRRGGMESGVELLNGEAIGVEGKLRVEADPTAQSGVVQEYDDLPPAGQFYLVRLMITQGRRLHLPGRQDGVGDPSLHQDGERFQVYRGLGQPHALRLMTEAMLKVSQSPGNLGDFILVRGKRQDGVVVSLGKRVAYAVRLEIGAVL